MNGAAVAPYEQTKEAQQISDLQSDLREQKEIVRRLYGIFVRTLVVLKNLVRVGAVAYVWRWPLPVEFQVFSLVGFILVIGLLQLAIDKARKTVNPQAKLSEWDVV